MIVNPRFVLTICATSWRVTIPSQTHLDLYSVEKRNSAQLQVELRRETVIYSLQFMSWMKIVGNAYEFKINVIKWT